MGTARASGSPSWAAGERIRAVLRAAVVDDPGVDLLVVFGSVARGEAHAWSDIDLLVDGPAAREPSALTRFRGQLWEALERPIELLTLSEAHKIAPVLAGAVRDGVVIVDRFRQWDSLLRMRNEIERDAAAEARTYPARRAAALARLNARAQP
jgi:predicted nucleotidyltransferase